MTTDGFARRTTAHDFKRMSVKRMAALAVVVGIAPLAAACSTSNSSAQPPLYLTNEGAYPYNGQAQQTADASYTDPADLVTPTPASARSGWGNYSGARQQAVAPAPVSNVYRGRNTY